MREEDIIINTLTSIEEIAIVVVELGLYDLARSFRHKLGDKMSTSAQVDDRPSISGSFNQLNARLIAHTFIALAPQRFTATFELAQKP